MGFQKVPMTVYLIEPREFNGDMIVEVPIMFGIDLSETKLSGGVES